MELGHGGGVTVDGTKRRSGDVALRWAGRGDNDAVPSGSAGE